MKFQRHIDMLQYITNKGSATIEELIQEFNISKATLNRDITELVKSGNIEKVHGGVVSTVNSGEFEMLIDDKEHLHIEEKKAIAKKACSLLIDNDNIIIDSGSTMFYFAKELANNKKLNNITIATNDIKVAYTLSSNPNIRLVMMGGIKHSDGYDVYGDKVSDIIKSLNITKYFIASSAWDIKTGITHTNYEDVLVKKEFLNCSQQCILLSDSSKDSFEKRFKICGIESIDKIITDSNLSEEKAKKYIEKGVDVIIA